MCVESFSNKFPFRVLVLLDLDFGKCKPVHTEAHVVDLSVNSTGEIMALTENGGLLHVELQHAIPHAQGDPVDELAVSLLARRVGLESKKSCMKDLQRLFGECSSKLVSRREFESVLKNSAALSIGSYEQLNELWRSIQAEPLCQLNQSSSSTGRAAIESTAVHL